VNLQIVAYIIGLMLEALVVDAMRRGPYKVYPFVFLYSLVDFVTTLLEIEPSLAFNTGSEAAKHRWSWTFWIDEQIIQALLFLVVISLIYRASAQTRQRRTVLTGLIGATLLVAAASFAAHWGPNMKVGKWMTPWTRDLNFCAAVLDLGLWALLIRSGEKDYRLLMLSGALGIQFAAGAMGQALRQVSPDSPAMDTATGLMIMIANLARTYIWWQAFRPPKNPKNAYKKRAA
jgi:hypothetical protein